MAASERKQASGPLAGVRVIDLTSIVFGPYATQTLGDLGADVIKIEPPGGDTTRYTGPRVSADMASLFMGSNRNKRSIVLDLKVAKARDVLLRMVDRADVFVHNMRPQKVEAFGSWPGRAVCSAIRGWSMQASMVFARTAPTVAGRPMTTSSRACAGWRA